MKLKFGYILLILIIGGGFIIAGIINVNYYSDDPDSAHNRSKNNVLDVINPNDVNDALVDSSMQHIRKGHTIKDFSFLNQMGKEVTLADLDGKIYVANFFFTTCGGICPKMSKQLQRVQTEFSDDDNFMILSHTVNPKYDSVPVMFNYAERFEADHDKWWFLTGSKEELYISARQSYMVVPSPDDPHFQHGDESDFIHTENFVLIDPDKRIRGMYDGTNKSEVSEMMRDIYDLKKEYKLN
ncbi:MAG: SCO family protein [Flavobacteriales bacterium]|jgi:protein SCO1/2|nr:SCO family protein [Flavobacteriales bacterium]